MLTSMQPRFQCIGCLVRRETRKPLSRPVILVVDTLVALFFSTIFFSKTHFFLLINLVRILKCLTASHIYSNDLILTYWVSKLPSRGRYIFQRENETNIAY